MSFPSIFHVGGFVMAALTLASGGWAGEVAFQKVTLTSQYWCDGVNAADINRDGHLDIIAGPFWYAGPDFKTARSF
jgi:hypothetical protein